MWECLSNLDYIARSGVVVLAFILALVIDNVSFALFYMPVYGRLRRKYTRFTIRISYILAWALSLLIFGAWLYFAYRLLFSSSN